MGDRLGHEGGVDVVRHRRLADGALQQEHLVGQGDGVAVPQVDLHLGRALFVDQRVHLQVLGLGEGVDVLEDGVELVDGADRIGPPAGLGAAGAADRRFERIVGVGVALDEIELQLRGDDRGPAFLAELGDDALQHLARGDLHRPAVVIVGVVDHLRGRLGRPRHGGEGGEIRPQLDVAV